VDIATVVKFNGCARKEVLKKPSVVGILYRRAGWVLNSERE
jgi:hypothetical protein